MDSKPGIPQKKKKVWKGEKSAGPAPARHIPWPEIFKHHISVVEGHLRMMEMIQKHTVQGTGNYETITNMVKRTKEMLYQTKDATRSFVPPKNQRESVPLGSSSYSMYPGYSPEDIEYGKAAVEAGQALGELKKQGIQWKAPNGAEYQVGQAHGAKRKAVFSKERTESTGSEGATKADDSATSKIMEPAQEEDGGENQYFVIDTKPTPLSIPIPDKKLSKKRSLEVDADGSQKKSKKAKKDKEIVVETEDITADVEANLKAKEEKAKSKDEKKRRRSNGDESEKVSKKPKKEKSKKRESISGGESNDDGEGNKKKKKKKTKDTA